jgi:lipoate-protein ligase A
VTGSVCWIEVEPRPGWHNMAVDAAMLDVAAATGVMLARLYQWEPHCLSFGRHEPASRRYDRDRIRALGLDCVRRPTGGRAVWHARELTYSVAAPAERLGSLPSAYRSIHEWLAGALERLGAAAVLAPHRAAPSPGAGPCFAAAVGGEILVAGHKVAGSAQRRAGGALLQHGSLLLEDDQEVVRSLRTDPGSRPDPADAEAPLARLLGRPVGFRPAALAFSAELQARGFPAPLDRPPNDVTARAPLHYQLFRSDRWTWAR